MKTPWVVKRTEKAHKEWEKRILINALKSYRKRIMISQEKLATILNVSMVTVSRWERGVSKPSQMAMKTLVKKGVLACLKS